VFQELNFTFFLRKQNINNSKTEIRHIFEWS